MVVFLPALAAAVGTSSAFAFLSFFVGGWAAARLRDRKKDRVPSMSRKVVIVTGGNAGIGLGVVRGLAAAGASVVLCARSLGKGKAARASVLSIFPQASIEVMELDLASFKSIQNFTISFLAKHELLNVLVLNAGVARTVTESGGFKLGKEGLEEMIGTNFIGHFLLLTMLLPTLRNTPGRPRVIATTSVAAANSYARGVDVSTWTAKAPDFSDWMQYGQSKLCLALMAQELQRREPALLSVACHPGVVHNTGLLDSNCGIIERCYQLLLYALAMREEDGARNSLYLASTEQLLVGGAMYHPVGRLGPINVGRLQRLGSGQWPSAMACGGADIGSAAGLVWEAAERIIEARVKADSVRAES